MEIGCDSITQGSYWIFVYSTRSHRRGRGAIDFNYIKSEAIEEKKKIEKREQRKQSWPLWAERLNRMRCGREKKKGATKNGRRSRSLPPRRKGKKGETDRKKVGRKKKKEKRGSDRSQSDLPLGKYTAATRVPFCVYSSPVRVSSFSLFLLSHFLVRSNRTARKRG